MANNNPDIQLLATLDENSSEAEILRVVKILSNRIKANSNARIELKADVDIDTDALQKALKKLDSLMKTKELSIETKNSIVNIQKEADAMLEVVSSANKASKEKLEFVNANRRVAESAENSARAIRNERDAMESLDDIDYIMDNINMQARNGNSAFQQFGNTLRDAFSTYTVANLLEDAIYKVVDAGKEAIDTVKTLDDINVDLQMATGEDKSYVKDLLTDYNALGQELGSLTQDVAKSTDSFLRQGRSMSETNQLIQDSMVLSKVAKVDSEESSKILTATLNGFKLAAEEASRVNDILTSIDLESASDAGGIGTALSKVASMANNAGVSLEKTTAIIATMSDVTQDSDEAIGNAVKSILSRMNQIRAGKYVDAETGEALNDVEKVLSKISVSMRDSNGVFKESEVIIDEVGQKWQTLDKNTQKAVATAMGGTYQYNKLISMFDNYSKVLSLTNVAMNSEGQALSKFENSYLPSLESKTNSLKASLENLASTTISDELYADVLDTTKAMVDMTAESGILKGALVGLGTSASIYVFQQLAGYLRNATQEFSNFGDALNMTRNGQVGIDDMQTLIDLTGGLTQSQTRLLLSTDNLTDAQKVAVLMNQRIAQGLPPITEEQAMQQLQTMGVSNAQGIATGTTISLTSAMRGLWATLVSNPLVLVTAAVTAGVTAWNKYKQAQEETRETAVQLTNDYKDQSQSLEENIAKYKELKEQLDNSNLSTDEARSIKEQLLEIQNSLMESYGAEASNLDLVNGKYAEQLGLLGELSKEKANDYVAENYSAFRDAKKALEKERRYDLGALFSFDTENGMTDAQEQLLEFAKSYSDLFTIKSVQDASTASTRDFTPKIILRADVETAEETIRQFQKDFENYIQLHGDVDIDVDSIRSGISDALTEITTDDELNDYKAIYDEYMKAEVVRNDTLRGLYSQSIQAVEDYNKALTSGEGIEEAKANLDSVKQSVQGATDAVEGSQGVFDDIFGQELTVDEAKSTKNVQNAIDTVQDNVKDTSIDVAVNVDTTKDSDRLAQIESLSHGFDQIETIYNDVKDKKEFDWSSILNNDDFLATFGDMTNVTSEYQNAYEEFITTVADSPSNIVACQDAFDNLATAYIYNSDALKNVTSDTKQATVTMLKQMGVINALEVVEYALSQTEGVLNNAKQEQIAIIQALSKEVSNETEEEELNRLASIDLANAEYSEMQALLDAANAAGISQSSLVNLMLAKIDANNTSVYTGGDIQNLIALAEQANLTANALRNVKALSGLYSAYEKAVADGDTTKANAINAQMQNTADTTYQDVKNSNKAKVQYDGSATNKSGGGSKSDKEKSKTQINWIAQYLERIQEKIDATKAKFDNLFTVDEKKSNLNKQIKQTTKLLEANEKATKKYDKKASKVKLSDGLKKKVREGKIKGNIDDLIKEYGEETANKIEEYKKWYNLARESEQQVDELETEIRNLKEQKYQLYVDDAESKISNANAQKELAKGYVDQNKYLDEQKTYLKQSYDYQIKIAELTNDTTKVAQLQAEYQKELWDLEKEKFDNIETYYENQISLLELSEKKIQEQIDLLETKGMTVNAKYYKSEIAYQEGIRGEYELSKKALQDQLTVMENAGLKGSDAWYESVVALNDVDSAIAECNTTIAEMNNNITEVANTIQTRLINSISAVSEEMDWIANLMSDRDLINDNAGFTKEGLATMGTYVSGMNTSSYASEMTKGLLDEMQKALDNNELTFTYNGQEWIYNSKEQLIDAITEVNSTYRDQITDIFDYSTKLVDLMIQKYEAELSSLKELIDRKRESINLEKEMNSYKNTLSDKVENVSTLQKQLVAYSGDTSEEGRSRLQSLQKQLDSARKDLEQTEYEKAIQDSEAMLDRLYSEYEDLINKKTSDRDALLQQAKDAVTLSANNIQQTITDVAEKYDYTDVLSNIQTGLSTMTGNDSALESIKTSVLSSIETAGTVPTAIGGLQLSIENGLSTITTLLQQILTSSGTTIPTSVENGTDNSSSVTIGGETYGTGYHPLTAENITLDNLVKEDKLSDKISAVTIPKDNLTPKNISADDIKLFKEALKSLGYKGIDTSSKKWGSSFKKAIKAFKKDVMGNKNGDGEVIGEPFKKKLISQLQIQGFSKGGIVSVKSLDDQIKANGDTVLVSANPGEALLTPAQTDLMQKFINNGIPELVSTTNMLQPLVNVPKLPDIQPLNSNTNNVVQIDNVTLPNVTNYNEFKTQMFKDMQSDRKFEKMIQSMSVDRLAGGSNLDKYRIKF